MGTNYYANLVVGFQFRAFELYKLLNGKPNPAEFAEYSYEITIPNVGVVPFGDGEPDDFEEAVQALIPNVLIDGSHGGDGSFNIDRDDNGNEIVEYDYPIVIGLKHELPGAGSDSYGYRLDVGCGLAIGGLVEIMPLLDELAQRIEAVLGIPMKDRAAGVHISYHVG